jgi:hypothetical protein
MSATSTSTKRKRLQKLPPETLQEDDQEDDWVKRISRRWFKVVESIIETGRLLIKAKEELGHGRFGEMIQRGDMLFRARTAQCLMAIARNPVLSNPQYVSHLPPSWGTLYDLTALPADRLVDLIEEDGRITPNLQRHEVKALGVDHLERVPGAFNTLFALMERYPNPEDMMPNFMRLGGWKPSRSSAVASMDELPEWIIKLAAAWDRELEKERLEWEEERKYQREQEKEAWARIQEAIDRKAAREKEENPTTGDQKSAPKRRRRTPTHEQA